MTTEPESPKRGTRWHRWLVWIVLIVLFFALPFDPIWPRYIWGVAFCGYTFWIGYSAIADWGGHTHARSMAKYIIAGLAIAFAAALGAVYGGTIGLIIALVIWISAVLYFLLYCLPRAIKARSL